MIRKMPWLRLYTEIIDDEKLGLLAFEDRWHYVALLCLKGKGVLDEEADPELLMRKVAYKLGLTCSETEKVAARLAKMGLIDADTFQPLSWDNRQYESDFENTNAERQKRFRERKKGVTGSVTLRNVTVTPLDTDTDTETDTDNTACVSPVSKFPNPPIPENPEPPDPQDPPEPQANTATMASAVCVALKSVGLFPVSPSHQGLRDLIDAGAEISAFVDAGRAAVERKKGFPYVLGIVRNQMAESADRAHLAVRAAQAKPSGLLPGAI